MSQKEKTIQGDYHLYTVMDEKIAGAALNVLNKEPSVPAEFIRPNVILTSHYACGPVETRKAMSKLVRKNINSFVTNSKVVSPGTYNPSSRILRWELQV